MTSHFALYVSFVAGEYIPKLVDDLLLKASEVRSLLATYSIKAIKQICIVLCEQCTAFVLHK